MTWKDILKMPMPQSVATDRDAEFKQKIIQFEKENIEPAFTQYVQSLGAGQNVEMRVLIDTSNYGKSGLPQGSQTFSISRPDFEKLGDNSKLIIETIAELYKNEGYEVKVGDNHLKFNIR